MTWRPSPNATASTPGTPQAVLRMALVLSLAAAPAGVWAQGLPTTAAPDTARSAPPAAEATAAAAASEAPADAGSPARVNTRGEPAVRRRVLQDEHIIIEELLVRGQPVRISVRGTTPGARGYEVNVGPGGRDASQESGRAGQSAWRLFSF